MPPIENLSGTHPPNARSTLIAFYSDTLTGNVRMDRSTHALEIIDYEHHEIHSGSHFTVSGYEAEDTAGTIIFTVTTPNTTTWAHRGTSNTCSSCWCRSTRSRWAGCRCRTRSAS